MCKIEFEDYDTCMENFKVIKMGVVFILKALWRRQPCIYDFTRSLKGLVLITYVYGESVQWLEMSIHRNTVHTADYAITTSPTNVGCIALCTSTPYCSYVTYTNDTSTCLRHQRLQGKQIKLNSRVWKKLCRSPFSYSESIRSCIFLPTVRLNWQDAKVDCEARNSRLLVADTMDKFIGVQTSFIQYLLLWVGGYPRTSDGKWIWLTGELVNKTMFHPGQPSGGPGRLSFWKNNGVLRLDDTFPTEPHHFICEFV